MMQRIIITFIILIGSLFCKKSDQNNSENRNDIDKQPTSLKNGLIAFYPFNGNANDESGNLREGVTFEVIDSSDRFGNKKSAYFFNGLNSYIEIPDFSDIELGGGMFSISVWVNILNINPTFGTKIISKALNGLVISNFDNGSSGLPNSNTKFGVGWDTYGKNSGIYPDILPKTSWNHIVCIKNTNGYDYYINNKKFMLPYNRDNLTKQDFDSPLIFGRNPLVINFFQGYLDDIRIYNRALTQEEITFLANN